jgi:hypothetical protein
LKLGYFELKELNKAGVKLIKIIKSPRINKQKRAYFIYKDKERVIDFGDPNLKEYPGTKRGDNYCTRSYGIKTKTGRRTALNPLYANFWSRVILWRCKEKKSIRR